MLSFGSGYESKFTLRARSFTDKLLRFNAIDATSCRLQGHVRSEDSQAGRVGRWPGEQEFPVVFSTPDGQFAMGIYFPDQPSKGFEKAGYGRFLTTRCPQLLALVVSLYEPEARATDSPERARRSSYAA